jgi:RND family efflux transporter, MFP subunit
MNIKTILIGLTAAALGVGGFGLYHLGLQRGMVVKPTAISAPADAQAADPSTWSTADGEAATKRHMAAGLQAGDTDPATGLTILYYHDPMVPGKKFEAPGKSPFMDMMLVPRYAGSGGSDDSGVTISPRVQQNLGIRFGEVIEGDIAPAVSAVGVITWNERSQVTVQARATGFVELLHVRATLDPVTRGQPLFDLYVPDWVAVQEEYLTLRQMQGRDLAALVEAAQQRMRQAGMSEAQITLVEKTGELQTRTRLVAPRDGVLTELMVREGSTVMPGMPLARINGLSTVWAEAEVPESQVTLLSVGSRVTAQSSALPGKVFEGEIQTLLPEVNPSTRTRRARVELDNPEQQLVPGMVVQMQLRPIEARSALLVPTEALIYTGTRTLVMVAEAEGSFHPVEVEAGLEVGDKTEIRHGLAQGQQVVLSGQFLIDSEASLRGLETRLTEPDAVAEEAIDAKTYRTQAVVEAQDGDMLTLSHTEIPALKWPAMTMDFRLAPSTDAAEFNIGDYVDVEFRMQNGDVPEIVRLQHAARAGGAQ